MVLYRLEKRIIMFDFKCSQDMDINWFEEEYNKNKDLLNYLVDNINSLDKVFDEIGYDKCLTIIKFLDLCEENYIVLMLMQSLITYCHQKEDTKFLELYMYFQNNNMDCWLEECSLEDLRMVKRCILADKMMQEAFPQIVDSILKKEHAFSHNIL